MKVKTIPLFKVLLFLGLMGLQGLPLNHFGLVALLFMGLWLFGLDRFSLKKGGIAASCLLILKILEGLIPHPLIEEGHNVFHPVSHTWSQTSTLPEKIQQELLNDFNKSYPPEKRCDKAIYGCWQYFITEQKDFAWSADGYFQKTDLSRRISYIDHESLATTKIGTINDNIYNFFDFKSDVKRHKMPYYFFYSLPQAFAGSHLTITGKTFTETEEGYIKQDSQTPYQIIIPNDGLKFYALNIDPEKKLQITLHKTLLHRIYESLGFFLILLVPALIFRVLFGYPSWKKIKIPFLSISSFFLTCLIIRPSVFTSYPILPGGGDGLVYEGFGRQILQALAQGDIAETFRGGESVYYFMPGLRYIKALEKVLVGESFMGLMTLVSLTGFFLYKMVQNFLSEKASFRVFAIFCFLPLFERFGFAAYHFVQKTYSGHGEPLAIMLFFTGASFMMRKDRPKQPILTFLACFLFSVSAFIRPAYLVPIGFFTICYFVYDLSNAYNIKKAFKKIIPYFGYVFLLVMPLHNYIFGKEFVLTTSAATHPVNLHVTFTDYIVFLKEILRINFQNEVVLKVFKHLDEWNGPSDFYRLLPLFYVFVHTFQKKTPLAIRALSMAALSSHILLLFYIAVGRYAYLAWTLTLIVFFYELETRLYPDTIQKWSLKLRQYRANKNQGP
tara:strand:+ start:973 stop:2982 length:2010 start_codon:yes stop_codon:yes gene_type:complete